MASDVTVAVVNGGDQFSYKKLLVDGNGYLLTSIAAGTVTVTGGLTDTQLRATPVPISGTVTANLASGSNVIGHVITDTGSTTAVTGTVTVTGALTDTQLRATPVPISGTITATISAGATTIAKAEDVASADADVGVPAMAIRKASPANTSGTDGDYEMLQMSAGRLWVDPSGVTLTVASHAVTNAGTFAVQAAITAASGALASGSVASGAIASGAVASGAFASGSIVAGAVAAGATSFVKLEDVASADADAGVPAMAIRKATPGNTSGTDGDYEMLQISAGRLWASAVIDTALPAGSNVIGHVITDTGSTTAVTGTVTVTGGLTDTQLRATPVPVSGTVTATIAAGATTIAKAEDVASADADVGVPAMAIRKASPANTSGTDGDYEMLQMSAGRLWVDPSGVTLTVASHAVTNAGTFAVQAAITAASGSIASGAISSGAIASGAVASGAVASGAFASGSIVAGAVAAGATSFVKLEDVASADADAGVACLAVRKATPANTSGTDGDYEFLQISAGRLWASAVIDTALPAGTNLLGKVGIDQTTPGTTNRVDVTIAAAQTLATVTTVSTVTAVTAITNALPAGTNSIGSVVSTKADIAPATQNITIQDTGSTTTSAFNSQSLVTGSPTANSTATFALTGINAVRVMASGVWTGTLQLEVSMDGGTTYIMNGGHQTGTSFNIATFTANASVVVNASGCSHFRVRAIAAMTGTATITVRESNNDNISFIVNPIKIADTTAPGTQATVKAASTAAAATDTALVVAISPNNSISLGVSATATGTSVQRNTALTSTAVAIKASAGNVYGWHFSNQANPGQDVYVHLYNTAAGSVTVGTTVPSRSYFIPGGGVLDTPSSAPLAFATAISYACSTTAAGGTAPTNALYTHVEFL